MSGSANKKYLDFIDESANNYLLGLVADHYGISVEEAYEEVVDEDAEYLFEYLVNDDARVRVYKTMTRLGL